jgi:hypothetical protein
MIDIDQSYNLVATQTVLISTEDEPRQIKFRNEDKVLPALD